MSIPVLAIPGFGPDHGRIRLDCPEGLTLAEIVDRTLGAAAYLSRLRVVLVSARGETTLIEGVDLCRIRPLAGVTVLIRVLPRGDDLRSILSIAVTIGATALGQLWAGPALSGMFAGLGLSGAVWASIATAGLTVAGMALVNWLLPPAENRQKQTYEIAGWRNQAAPNQPVPVPYGEIRYAPPYLCPPHIEIVGDDMYVRGAFVVGLGGLLLDDIRIGDTPLSEFSDIEVETRDGLEGDDPLTLITHQVIQEQVGAELSRDYPLDTLGVPNTSLPPVAVPVTRLTAGDVTEATIILNFPAGLWGEPGWFSSQISTRSVSLQIRYRPAGDVAWTQTFTISPAAAKAEGFFRQRRIAFPSRGRWEIEITNLDNQIVDQTKGQNRVVWYMLQSVRPEYPLNLEVPVALLAIRARATRQLNGQLDNVNLMVRRPLPAWNGTAWVEAETRNPAAIYRHALSSQANAYPDDSFIAGELEDWFEFCVEQGLHYDRVHDFSAPLSEVLNDIARAGRASPRREGSKWGVVIDRPRDMVVAHLNERNAHSLIWRRSYDRRPDGVRVNFLDRTASYQSRERVIPWPGHVGEVLDAEDLPMPGKTDPEEVYREATRHMLAVEHRRDIYTAIQDGAVRTATRGDLVKANFESLRSNQAALRVIAVRENYLTLDGVVTMEAGQNYAIRFLVENDADQALVTSVLRSVMTVAGEHGSIGLTGTGSLPDVGILVQFGLAGSESIDLIVVGIEAGEDMSTVMHAVQAAPEIDTILAALVVPDWDGRVGEILALDTTAPSVPEIVSISPSIVDEVAAGVRVVLQPGPGAVPLEGFEVRHRLTGSPTWLGPVQDEADGTVIVPGYVSSDSVELQWQAISLAGIASGWGSTVTYVVPSPQPVPAAVPSGSVTAGLGHSTLAFATPADGNLATVRIYRGPSSTFGAASLVVEMPVLPGSSYGHVDGDATRTNIFANSGFASSASWAFGTGWTHVTDHAHHASGSTGLVSQAFAGATSQVIRYGFDVSGFSGSGAQLYMGAYNGGIGGTLRGNSAVQSPAGGSGSKVGAFTLSGTVTDLGLVANSTAVVDVDNVIAYVQSPTSLAQGTHYYFLTSANGEGAESAPLALGPITII